MLDLVGDVGATNARFATVDENGNISTPRVYALDDHPNIAEALETYLAEESPPMPPDRAVLAVAAPMIGDRVTLTNHPWTFSIEDLRRRIGLTQLQDHQRLRRQRACCSAPRRDRSRPGRRRGAGQRRAHRRHRTWHRSRREFVGSDR